MIFLEDLLGGMLLLISLLLLIIAILTYRRYHFKAALISSIVFLLFFAKAVIYEANTLLSLGLDIMTTFFLTDVFILITLYFAIAMRG
ncbi:MAG: hypothetical protein J7L63_02585 [Thermoplasmata archaeon]|nr:hypothetical protein [Thermoplasmata archaeon]